MKMEITSQEEYGKMMEEDSKNRRYLLHDDNQISAILGRIYKVYFDHPPSTEEIIDAIHNSDIYVHMHGHTKLCIEDMRTKETTYMYVSLSAE